MQYCEACLYPSTRPEQVFQNGICDACNSSKLKHGGGIDWAERKLEFVDILNKYRGDGSKYDCIVPVSGGKDSCYQALRMRDEYGMSPLCVTFTPCELTEVGHKNLIWLRDIGFDLIQVSPNRRSYKEMVRIGFTKLGDSCWPEHIGVFTAPVRVAVQYDVPLIIWGENSQFEYGGPASHRERPFLDKNWLEQFLMCGYRLDDVVNHGIPLNDVKMLQYPSDEELFKSQVTGLFLGYYEKWDTQRNLQVCEALGWSRSIDGPIEGAWNDFENLDCKWIGGLHDYMKFLKYGYGRATDQLNIEIRAGRLTREEAIEILGTTSEGKLPRRYIPDFLEYLNIPDEEFYYTLDKFTNKRLFETHADTGELVKDENGDVVRKFWPQ